MKWGGGLRSVMEGEIKKKRGFYEIEGKQLPAVTKVIGDTLAKNALLFWYGDVGNSEARRISEEAKSFGSAMHKMIAEYLRSGVEPTRDALASEVKQAWDVWYEWWGKASIRVKDVEQTIHNDEYAGTCDLLAFSIGSDPKEILVDWKFSSGIYAGNKIQMGAYAKLLNAEKAIIVRVAKKEKNIEILEMNKEELEEASRIFDCLLEVFKWGRKK